MTKLLAICTALLVAALLALSDPAGAAQQRPDGYRNNDQIEVSSARRHRRYYSSRRYYRPRYYAEPVYAPAPYYAYQPYYRPAPFPFIFGLPGY